MPPFKPGTPAAFLYSQFFVTPTLDPSLSFSGQTVIVTGSNVGLGFSAAQQIAQRGASKVILAVRTISKGEAAAAQIRSSLPTGNSSTTDIDVWPLDLSSYQSVKDFAARARQLERLDVLLENAAVAKMVFDLNGEGDEETITTNVVSPALLALLLLPKMRETASKYGVLPHLTIVSSEVAYFAAFEERKAENIFEALSDPKSDMRDRYTVSKLLENFIVRELAERISTSSSSSSSSSASPEPPIIINTVNPGFCESSLRRNAVTILSAIQFRLMEFFLQRKTAVGARTLVHAVSAGRESHGQFLSDCRVEVSPLDMGRFGSDERELRRRIWSELCMKLERIEPGISRSV